MVQPSKSSIILACLQIIQSFPFLTFTIYRLASSGPKKPTKGKKPAVDDGGEDEENNNNNDDPSNEEDDNPPDDSEYRPPEPPMDGPDTSQRPLFELRDIISELLDKAQQNGLSDFVDSGDKHYIRVGTMCSGTDAPLHALNMFGMLKNAEGEQVFTAINVFACEIEPYKQAFLSRNSRPQLLFRDAADFAEQNVKQA